MPASAPVCMMRAPKHSLLSGRKDGSKECNGDSSGSWVLNAGEGYWGAGSFKSRATGSVRDFALKNKD